MLQSSRAEEFEDVDVEEGKDLRGDLLWSLYKGRSLEKNQCYTSPLYVYRQGLVRNRSDEQRIDRNWNREENKDGEERSRCEREKRSGNGQEPYFPEGSDPKSETCSCT